MVFWARDPFQAAELIEMLQNEVTGTSGGRRARAFAPPETPAARAEHAQRHATARHRPRHGTARPTARHGTAGRPAGRPARETFALLTNLGRFWHFLFPPR